VITTLPDVKWINPTYDVIQWKGTMNMEMMWLQNSKEQNTKTDWLLGVRTVGTIFWCFYCNEYWYWQTYINFSYL